MSAISTARKRRLAACTIAILAGLTGWWYFASPPTPNGQGEVGTQHPLPPVSASRFLNTSAEVGYVGQDSCASCHPAQQESYLQTAHSRAFGEIDLANEPPDGEFEHAPSGRTYRIYRDGEDLRHEEAIETRSGGKLVVADFPMRYVMGSGRFSKSYLVEADGFLVESPATWYKSRPGWAISPGYDTYNTGFERAAEIRCINCHVGRAEPIDNSPQRIKIHTHAIDCERCHGPGALHSEHRKSKSATGGEIDLTIVNPRHLDRERREAICAQCHQHGAATVDIRGRQLSDFKPGLRLCDFTIHYGLENPDRSMMVVGHVEQMHLSRCYLATDTLTCTTCHDPHGKPAAEEAVSYYRSKCLSCHAVESCGLSRPERISKNADDDCAACHMPRSPTEIPHFAFTHHRIGIHESDPPRAPSTDSSALVPIVDVAHLPQIEQDRLLGLAYLQVSELPEQAEHAESYLHRSRKLLEDVRSQGVRDAEVDAALARLYWGQDPQRTLELSQSVLGYKNLTPDAYATALFTLGSTHFQLRNSAQAAEVLEKLVRVRRYGDAWQRLSICRAVDGDIKGALEAAHKAAEISPLRPDFHETIAECYRQAGNAELSAKHSALAQELHRHQRRLEE